MITYEHPASGDYATTIATLPNGMMVSINTQYEHVAPLGAHPESCGLNKMGGRCDCGKLGGIDIPALIADARKNGKFGRKPTPKRVIDAEEKAAMEEYDRYQRGLCPHCGGRCHGDCKA